jgi:hypothetical protein
LIESRQIKRYNAYYHGWCLAFGEHSADYEEEEEINWLFGEQKAGLILSPRLLKQAQLEFLGHRDTIPELAVSELGLRMNSFLQPLSSERDRENARRLKAFLLQSRELHMFLSNHLFYQGKRIITFDQEKPLVIMYKEMEPLQLIIE